MELIDTPRVSLEELASFTGEVCRHRVLTLGTLQLRRPCGDERGRRPHERREVSELSLILARRIPLRVSTVRDHAVGRQFDQRTVGHQAEEGAGQSTRLHTGDGLPVRVVSQVLRFPLLKGGAGMRVKIKDDRRGLPLVRGGRDGVLDGSLRGCRTCQR